MAPAVAVSGGDHDPLLRSRLGHSTRLRYVRLLSVGCACVAYGLYSEQPASQLARRRACPFLPSIAPVSLSLLICVLHPSSCELHIEPEIYKTLLRQIDPSAPKWKSIEEYSKNHRSPGGVRSPGCAGLSLSGLSLSGLSWMISLSGLSLRAPPRRRLSLVAFDGRQRPSAGQGQRDMLLLPPLQLRRIRRRRLRCHLR